MEWLFVFGDGGWWLKIADPDQLMEYHKLTDGARYEDSVKMAMDGVKIEELSLEKRIEMMSNRSYKYLQAATIQAQMVGGTILDGFRCLNMELGAKELRNIREDGQVFINRVGGSTFYVNEEQFCRRKEMIFPNFTERDIRIKRFEGGNHYYAYIGDMQVRSGSELKWNTYEAAQAAALKVVRV